MAASGYGPDGIKRVQKELEPGSAELDPRPLAIYVNGAGTATLVDEQGTAVVYNLVLGQILPFSPVKFTAGDAELVGWN